jgi:arsenite-transporting ATPase
MDSTPLARLPRNIAGAPGLKTMNIDPEAAAEAYRLRVIAQILSRH